MYFPHGFKKEAVLKAFEELQVALAKHDNFIIGGDFNGSPSPIQGSYGQKLADFLEKNPEISLLSPQGKTIVTGNTRDHFMVKTEIPELFSPIVKTIEHLSDHFGVALIFGANHPFGLLLNDTPQTLSFDTVD